mgnify:CR=1 FL=1
MRCNSLGVSTQTATLKLSNKQQIQYNHELSLPQTDRRALMIGSANMLLEFPFRLARASLAVGSKFQTSQLEEFPREYNSFWEVLRRIQAIHSARPQPSGRLTRPRIDHHPGSA